MTREEAKRILNCVLEEWVMDDNVSIPREEALRFAIKALEQESMREFTEEEAKAYSKALDKMYKPTGFNVFDEPSGDLISRQAVNEIINDIRDCISVEGYCAIFERLKKLPSVKQEPKTGHWIKSNIPNEEYVCSECGGACWYYDYQGDVAKSRYCPNCGCRMVEPQESEG